MLLLCNISTKHLPFMKKILKLWLAEQLRASLFILCFLLLFHFQEVIVKVGICLFSQYRLFQILSILYENLFLRLNWTESIIESDAMQFRYANMGQYNLAETDLDAALAINASHTNARNYMIEVLLQEAKRY